MAGQSKLVASRHGEHLDIDRLGISRILALEMLCLPHCSRPGDSARCTFSYSNNALPEPIRNRAKSAPSSAPTSRCVLVGVGLSFALGWKAYLALQVIVIAVAGAGGMWLFVKIN
jgi:hypothetical protein